MKKSLITLFGLAALAPAWAQDANVMEASASARMAYQERQALAEVPRLVQQFEVLANNQEQIAARLVKVESGSGDAAELRADVDKLRGEIAELRAEVRRDQEPGTGSGADTGAGRFRTAGRRGGREGRTRTGRIHEAHSVASARPRPSTGGPARVRWRTGETRRARLHGPLL